MNKPKMYSKEELTKVFKLILESKEDSKLALSDPSKILAKYGLNIPDPKATNSIIFEAAPQLKAHFLAVAAGKQHDDSLLGCDSPGCIACKSGLAVGGTALILAALAGGAEAIAALAEFCGLSVEVVANIIKMIGSGGLSAAISALCDAMGAC